MTLQKYTSPAIIVPQDGTTMIGMTQPMSKAQAAALQTQQVQEKLIAQLNIQAFPPTVVPATSVAALTVPQDIGDITWSHSSLEQADQCMKKYYETRVVKSVKYIQGTAAARGELVHNAIEHWFKGDSNLYFSKLAEEDRNKFNKFLPILEQYKAVAAQATSVGYEEEIVMDREGKPSKWFDKHTKIRAKLDKVMWFPMQGGGNHLYIVDWKTGKKRDTRPQAERYAWLAFKKWPSVQKVTVQFAYFDSCDTMPAYSWTRDEKDGLATRTISTLNKILDAFKTNVWPASPTPLCGWCDVTACQHNTKRTKK